MQARPLLLILYARFYLREIIVHNNKEQGESLGTRLQEIIILLLVNLAYSRKIPANIMQSSLQVFAIA